VVFEQDNTTQAIGAVKVPVRINLRLATDGNTTALYLPLWAPEQDGITLSHIEEVGRLIVFRTVGIGPWCGSQSHEREWPKQDPPSGLQIITGDTFIAKLRLKKASEPTQRGCGSYFAHHRGPMRELGFQ
jgi:hypothetical protein